MRAPLSNTSCPASTDAPPASMRSSVVFTLPLRPDSVSRSRRSSLNDTPRKSGSPAMSLPRSDAIATAIAPDGRSVLVLLRRPLRRHLVGHVAPAGDHRRVRVRRALALHAAPTGGAENGDARDRQSRIDARPVTPLASDETPHRPAG